ncbi:MAG: putative zinc-binding metallopeptidase [Mangrovibacterium sp.]
MKTKYILTLIIGLFFSACSEDALTDSIIKDSDEPTSEIDLWISENMNKPYNIEVVYKWDDEETEMSKNLVPAIEDSVIGFLDVLKTLWIDTYVANAGEDFFKTLSPKQILLIGSKSYNSDGTVTEGTAEGGRKIVLYSVNNFERHDKDDVKYMIHIVHHEFAHIMTQIKDYDESYGKITPAGYTSTWFNSTMAQAQEIGFITNYAQMNTDEDFVEMIATILTHTNEEWEQTIAAIASADARDALKQKEEMIADYFMTNWGIDLYQFQDLVSSEINKLVNP